MSILRPAAHRIKHKSEAKTFCVIRCVAGLMKQTIHTGKPTKYKNEI